MESTHLITQAVVAGLQGQIDTVTNQLNTANSDLASAIQGLINSLNTAYDTVRSNLEAHVLEDYSTVHGGATSAQVNYLDSAANIVGDYVVGINIGGTQLWLPASTAQEGVCHSQCHCRPVSDTTKVLGPDGALGAAQLVPGAKVYSYEDGSRVVGTVTGRGLTGSQEIYAVTVGGHTHRFGSGHRLLMENGAWTECKDLRPGVRVQFLQDRVFEPVEVESVEPDGVEETWDIEVDKKNYVLETGVLCHNSACNCTCTPYGSPMVMADGSVKGVQSLKVGDKLTGFHDGYYVETTVDAVHSRDARVLRYHLDNGTYVDSTEDHRWFIDDEYKPAHPGSRLRRFKRAQVGFQVESDVVMVERVEDLGMMPVYSVTTSTGNYLNQGHLSANCEFW